MRLRHCQRVHQIPDPNKSQCAAQGHYNTRNERSYNLDKIRRFRHVLVSPI